MCRAVPAEGGRSPEDARHAWRGQRLRIASAREAGGRHSVKGCQTQMVILVFSGVVRVIYVFGVEAEVAAGHVGGRGFAEDAEHGGCDVAEGAAGGELERVVFGDTDEGDGIGGVVGVRAAGGGIDHGFGVAVIGGDDPRAATWA